MTFWRQLLQTIARNPISLFAVLCVSCTAAYLGWLTYRLMLVLESPAWCGNALKAEKIVAKDTFVGLTSCVELLKVQLQAVATGFHISTGGFVFVLIVLIVVVVAGARASGKLGSSGLEFDMSRQDAAAAGAEHVTDAAKVAEAEVKGTTP
jgi:hypothetical protein